MSTRANRMSGTSTSNLHGSMSTLSTHCKRKLVHINDKSEGLPKQCALLYHYVVCTPHRRQGQVRLLFEHEATAAVSAHAMTMNRLSCSQRCWIHELRDAIPARCKAMGAALAKNKFTFALAANFKVEVSVAASAMHGHLLLQEVFRQSCAHARIK